MPESSTRTVERALALLASVCDRGHATLAEASRDAELPASTALRLMRTLESSDFLARDPDNGYRAGSRLIQLGAQAFTREMLVSLSAEPMQEVVEATGESVYLSVPGPRDSVLYVSIVEGTHSVRHTNWVGRTIPRRGSAAGAAMRGDVPKTGYVALENTVEADVTAISAPILTGSRAVAAMSTLVPTYRIDEAHLARCGEALVQATTRVAAALGEADGHP